MQNWIDLYTELCALLKAKVPDLKWMDLWRNQVGFLETEDPFPAPALFFAFRIAGAEDAGQRVQRLRVQLTVYLYYETLAGSQHDSWNQADALKFLELISEVFAALHGTDGVNYSQMRRLSLDPMETSGAGNLYQMAFECLLMDYAAMKDEVDAKISGIDIEKGPVIEDGPEAEPLFTI